MAPESILTVSGNGSANLRQLADRVVEELHHHVSVMTSGGSDATAAVAANDALGAAALAYADAVFDLTGWGNPFTPPPRDEDEVEPEAEVPSSAGAASVLVEARYELLVEAPRLLQQFLHSRGIPTEGLNSNDGVDMVSALFLVDGWDLSKYDDAGLRVLDSSWAAGPAPAFSEDGLDPNLS